MAYIGREPQIGNFQVCDAISVVNGQAAYTMQVNSVNVSPETANHMLVSLNGVLQAPGSSYTVSGSTITFASNLVTGDVINFIHILGSVLDLGVPSNDTVGAAQIKDDLISGTTALAAEPADTDEFLVSDAGVLKRIDYSLIKGGGSHVLLATTNVTSGVAQVDFTSGIDSTYKNYMISFTDVHPATDSVQLQMRYSISSTFKTDTNYYYGGIGRESDASVISFADGTGSGFKLNHNLGNAGDKSVSGNVILHNPSGTTFSKMFQADATSVSAGSRGNKTIVGGFYNSGSAVDGVRFYMSSGNIDLGTFKLYGIV